MSLRDRLVDAVGGLDDVETTLTPDGATTWYDFDRLRSIMLAADLTTLQLVWREAVDRFRARDPFPVGNVVEDPATGAAAAAFGAHLRWHGELVPPARFTISQGVEMGRPSLIEVEVPDTDGGIRVTGTAMSLDPSDG